MVKKRLRTFLIAILVCCLVGTFYYTQRLILCEKRKALKVIFNYAWTFAN
jgi:hypothetical protein